jgi:inositol-hexakisphosphate kinase
VECRYLFCFILLILFCLTNSQVWDTKKETYVSQNKYFGRELQAEGFKNVLVSYLHDGEKLLVHHIPGLLQQIYGLARIIHRLNGYRFYGCSLLFIYEGDRDIQDAYLRSIADSNMNRSKRSESLDRQGSKRSEDMSDIRRARSEDLLFGPAIKRSHSARRKRGEVMIRLVDFAHTTTGQDYIVVPNGGEGKRSGSLSSGNGYLADIDEETGLIIARYPPRNEHLPDMGFLFGLRNIALTLEEIWNDERLRRSKASRVSTSVEPQLGLLPKHGKDIFGSIFGTRDQPGEFDPGMMSS